MTVVINPHTTRAAGTILTASIYNTDHQNHINNANALNAVISATAPVNSELTPPMFGIDTDETADVTVTVQTMLNQAAISGLTARFLARDYVVDALVLPSGVNVLCDPGAVFELLGTTPGSLSRIEGIGATSGTARALVTNAVVGDLSVEVGAGDIGVFTATVAANDLLGVTTYVIVRTNEFISGVFGRNQEIRRISGTSGNFILLYEPLIGAYATAATAEVILLNPVENVRWRGGKIIVPVGVDTGGGLFFEQSVSCQVHDVEVVGPNNLPGINFYESSNGLIENARVRDGQNVSGGGYGYGISVDDSSHDMRVVNCWTSACRENVVGNRARNVQVLGGGCSGMHFNGWNTHGVGAEDVTFGFLHITGTRLGPAISVSQSSAIAVDKRVKIIGCHLLSNFLGAIQSSGNASFRSEDVMIVDNLIDKVINTTNQIGIFVNFTDGFLISGNRMANADEASTIGIHCTNARFGLVADNDVRVWTGTAYRMSSCTSVTFDRNNMRDISGFGFICLTGNTDCVVSNHMGQNTYGTISIVDVVERGNVWQGGQGARAIRVVTAAGPVTVTKNDSLVVINKTVGAATAVALPASPEKGRKFTIKDGKGDCETNNITVTPAAGNIDGQADAIMGINSMSLDFEHNGTQYNFT